MEKQKNSKYKKTEITKKNTKKYEMTKKSQEHKNRKYKIYSKYNKYEMTRKTQEHKHRKY